MSQATLPDDPPSLVMMQPRVTAVLAARNGAEFLPRTLAALAAQVRRPDAIILVDSSSSDSTGAALAGTGPVVTTPGRRAFGDAVAYGLQVAAAPPAPDEWLWILGHDNAPEPGALAALLAAVEVAPSVAIAGPKLMRWDAPDTIASFGETVTRFGRSISLVTDELDQAQYDVNSDLLAVAAGGMLVRRSVWTALGGFDHRLPSVDAALDFCVRARLAGHRVVGVPGARVASAGAPELWGRRSLAPGAHHRVVRAAQLRRRMVWAPGAALVLHWLSLVPLAILRSLGLLLAKSPGSVGGEFAAALGTAFDGSVASARRGIRRTRVLGWAAVAPLRMTSAEVRERRAHARAADALASAGPRERPGFFAGGGAWVVLLALVLGLVAFGRFAGSPAIAGGGLAPLSSTLADLWSHIGYGWHDTGLGFLGPADPFAALLAVLGSLTFWSPSFAVVLLWVAALPLAALAAWWCAAAFSRRGWAPAVAAIGWALAPPFLASLAGGHLGAVVAHILLPTLVLAIVRAARSWAFAGVAALLFAAVAAASPILVPALLVMLVAWMFARPRGVARLLLVPLPAAALAAPLVVERALHGEWLRLLAEPGIAVLRESPSGWQLAIASPGAAFHGWDSLLASLGVPAVGAAAPIVAVVLLAPLAVLAVMALFLPGTRRSVPVMVIALLGFVSAVVASHVSVSLVGSEAVSVWAGAALSLYWLGLLGGAAVALEAFGGRAALPAWVAGLALVVVALPLVIASASGTIAVRESTGRLLPAFVTAEAASDPTLGTLELTAQPDGGLAADLHRGEGTTLDERSTIVATDTTLTEERERLAVLVGNLASRSGLDIAGELDELHIAFVVVTPSTGTPEAAATRQRALESLDGNRLLTPVGDTAQGLLWAYEGLGEGAAPTGPGPAGTPLGLGILIAQGVIVGLAVLLAIPTSRRRRVRSTRARDGVLPDPTSTIVASDEGRNEG